MADLARLRSLDVILTSRCNLSCGYCYQDDKRPGRMSWETLKASIDRLLGSGEDEVSLHFFGGEPLLEMPLVRAGVAYVERNRGKGPKVEFLVTTNGTRLDPATVSFLAAHDFELHLSFDGVAAAQDQRGRGTFAQLDRRLDRIRRRHRRLFREKLTIHLTLTAANLPYLADSIRYFLGKGVPAIQLGPAFTHQGEWRVERIEEMEAAFASVFADCLAHYRRTGAVPLTVFRRPRAAPRRRPARPMCNVGKGEALTVDVDGEVHGCVTFADSFQTYRTRMLRERLESMRLGDVAARDLPRRLAMYPKAVRAAGLFDAKADKHSSYGSCGDCRFLSSCSVCPVSIGNAPGNEDVDRVPDFQCAYHLVSLKYRERFPVPEDPLDRLRGGGLSGGMLRMLDLAQASGPGRSG